VNAIPIDPEVLLLERRAPRLPKAALALKSRPHAHPGRRRGVTRPEGLHAGHAA
jgi:hypothetical protein